MDRFVIHGGKPLKGEVTISGAKNAAVAILPAVLLADEPCRIENLPDISDVSLIVRVLSALGAKVECLDQHSVLIDPTTAQRYAVSAEMARGMRASSYFLGALLGRMHRAKVAPPGGCDFGVRPIDQHIKGFEALGADVSIEENMVICRASELRGGFVYLDVVSVGATINIMLAAVKTPGMTVIENAAREPHIVDLANFLNSMGANIMGAGTNVIKIRGVSYLQGVDYSIIPDQIEAGTYMVAAAATGGDVTINNVTPKHLESIVAKLVESGAQVQLFDESVRVSMTGRPHRCNIKTMPHPGFPTDMQPQFTAYLALAEGESVITEGVWDNRFRYAAQLQKMGARIQVEGKKAIVTGQESLHPAVVEATDLRGGAAMVIAGLSCHGESVITDIRHIERGYEDIVYKLSLLGADIVRLS